MITVYKANTNWNAVNVGSDLLRLACGYSISSLSIDCDKNASYTVANTIAADWELYDESYSVIRRQDAAGIYKYIRLGGYRAGYWEAIAYTTWNAATHTGTNLCGKDYGFGYAGYQGAPLTVIVAVSPTYVRFQLTGYSTWNWSHDFAWLEIDRTTATSDFYDPVNGHSSVFTMSSSYGNMPLYKNPSAVGDVAPGIGGYYTNYPRLSNGWNPGYTGNVVSAMMHISGAGEPVAIPYPLGVGAQNTRSFLGVAKDILLLETYSYYATNRLNSAPYKSYHLLAPLGELTINAQTYIVIDASADPSIIVPKA